MMTKAKRAVFGAVLLGVVTTPLVVQYQRQLRLLAENESLRQRLDQLDQLAMENERLSNLVAQATSGQSLAEEQMRELLRLRGEVARLRQDNKQIGRLRDEIRQLQTAQAQPTPGEGAVNSSDTAKPMSLYTRVIKVNPEPLLSRMSNSSTAVEGDSNQDVLHQEAFRQFFKDMGVDIEPPATVYMDKTDGTLIARTSLENLDKIEAILSTLGLQDQKTSTEDAGVFQPGEPTGK